MGLEYKIASAADIDTLVRTRTQVLKAANRLDDAADMSRVESESRKYYLRAIPDGAHTALLVYDGDEVVATGGVSFYYVMPTYHNPSGKKAYIMNMYTHPQYRRMGIAYKTLAMLVEFAKNQNVGQISLEATDMGRPLYEKFGFVAMESEMELPFGEQEQV